MIVLELDLDLQCSEQVAIVKDDAGQDLPVLSRRSVCTAAKVAAKNGRYAFLALAGIEQSEEKEGESTSFVLLVKPSVVEMGEALPEEPAEEEKQRIESTQRLKALGAALAMFANDNGGSLPDMLGQLRPYCHEQDFAWARGFVRYIGAGKNPANGPEAAVAFDQDLFRKTASTNVLFADGHVSLVEGWHYDRLGIGIATVQMDVTVLSVTNGFLEALTVDSVLPTVIVSEDGKGTPDAQMPSSFLLDEMSVRRLLQAVQKDEGVSVLASPSVLACDGDQAEVSVIEEIPYINGFTEPEEPGGKPIPAYEWTWTGAKLAIRPRLTRHEASVHLKTNLEIRSQSGHADQIHENRYKYKIPVLNTTRIDTSMLLPLGQTILISGQRSGSLGIAGTGEAKDAPTTSTLILIKATKAKQ